MQLGKEWSRKGFWYAQAREWEMENGRLVMTKVVDFTDHGRPLQHPNPHQHRYIENSTGGSRKKIDTIEHLHVGDEVLPYSYDGHQNKLRKE